MPPYSHQADVWVEMLKYFNYKKVIFIHSSDTDGRALLGRFQTTSQSLEDDVEIKVQVESIIEFEPGLDNFREQLSEMKNAQSRVFLLYGGYRKDLNKTKNSLIIFSFVEKRTLKSFSEMLLILI